MGSGSTSRYDWRRWLRSVAGGGPDGAGWRSRHPGIAGAAIAVLVAIAVGGAAMEFANRPPRSSAPHPTGMTATLGTPGAAAPPVAAPPSPAGSPAAVPSRRPSDVRQVTAAPSGTLFAIRDTCDGCEASVANPYDLLRSTDLGAAWARVGPLPGRVVNPGDRSPLLAAGDGGLVWVVGETSLFGSTDGGRTWRTWSLPNNAAPDGTQGRARVAAAGDTLWLLWGTRVLVARAGAAPVVTSLLIPDLTDIDAIAAASAARAVVLATAETNQASVGVAYGTTDGGGHWAPLSEPCPGAGVLFWSTVAFAPDGSLWAVCAGEPSAGEQGSKGVVISVDGGRSWTGHGALEDHGYGTDVVPVSATVAWRSGARADLYRTVDATRWTRVASTGDAGDGAGATCLTALDADTALYIGSDPEGDQRVLYVTRDGGRTWLVRPFRT